jgi:hypothetical protein
MGLCFSYPSVKEEEYDRPFNCALSQCTGGGNACQEAELLVLHQATGFGKSKLCYSLGMERFVCVIKVFRVRIVVRACCVVVFIVLFVCY